MQHQFRAISLSYKNAPLEVREAVALDESACKQLLLQLRDYINVSEALILSTCNRTEVYYTAGQDYNEEIIRLIGVYKGISQITDLIPNFICLTDNQEAIQHLFNVAIGLESQVVGDMQIPNQVKNAYQWAADTNMAGPFLHRLMHTIFFTNKKVVQQTAFKDGAASTSYATVELVEELTTDLQQPKLLVLGVGEIGADVCRNLAGKGFQDVSIVNRTFEKAEKLAEECNFKALEFENVWQHIAEADVVISSINRQDPFINEPDVAALKSLSYKYFIDLSVPRSVAQEVEAVPGVWVYNVDNLQVRANEALEKRLTSIPQVKEIIAESIVEFNDWTKEMDLSPTINKLKNALEQIRKEEIARYLKDMNQGEEELIDKVTKSIMQKIIKLPVLQLKAACKRGEADTLIDVLNDLFNLEKQKV